MKKFKQFCDTPITYGAWLMLCGISMAVMAVEVAVIYWDDIASWAEETLEKFKFWTDKNEEWTNQRLRGSATESLAFLCSKGGHTRERLQNLLLPLWAMRTGYPHQTASQSVGMAYRPRVPHQAQVDLSNLRKEEQVAKFTVPLTRREAHVVERRRLLRRMLVRVQPLLFHLLFFPRLEILS